MAKPAITKREVKGSVLSYAELDANFQNLADATISVNADGNLIVLDLNDTLTLTPGTGVTFGVVGNVVTINSTGGASGLTDVVDDTTPQLGGDLDVNGHSITNSQGDTITISEDVLLGNTSIIKISDSPGSNRIECTDQLIITAEISTLGGATNGPTINMSNGPYGGNINIGTDSDPDDKIFLEDVVNINNLTSTQITALTAPQNGDLVYNSSTHKFQGYANGSWVDLH